MLNKLTIQPVSSMHTYANNTKKSLIFLSAIFGDPDAIRTRDRLLRRQMLYPAELPDHLSNQKLLVFVFCGAKLINKIQIAISFTEIFFNLTIIGK